MALLQAYAQRCFTVAPITRSASSRNGTSVFFPYTSEVDAMTTFFFFLFACFSTTSVPCTLVSMVCTGCSTISFTPDRRREMKDDVVAIDELGEQRLVRQRVDDVFELRMGFQMADVADRSGRQVVDDVDFMPVIQQRLCQMRSDEACAAGD